MTISPELKERIEALIVIYENAADWADRTHPALAPAEHHKTALDLRALLTAAQGQEWRPIAEAPRDGTEVFLAFDPATSVSAVGVGSWSRTELEADDPDFWEGWTDPWGYGIDSDPTHWMPLPPPPQAEGEG